MVFPDKPYVSLENLDNRRFAEQDARGFFARYPDGAVIDEIQRSPDLLSYIQGIVDEKPILGEYIIAAVTRFELLSTHQTQQSVLLSGQQWT
jgi:hypothetical protein